MVSHFKIPTCICWTRGGNGASHFIRFQILAPSKSYRQNLARCRCSLCVSASGSPIPTPPKKSPPFYQIEISNPQLPRSNFQAPSQTKIYNMTCWRRKYIVNWAIQNPSAMAPKLMKMIRVEAPLLREIMAEFLGTFILVLFGDASVAQSKLSNEANGDFFSINWGWAVGVMMGVLVAGGVSGAHLNPAVTLAMACAGRIAIIKVFFYMLAQYLGAFAAAASVLGVYSDAIEYYSNANHNGTLYMNNEANDPGLAGIFATYPAPWLSIAGGIGDQILGTMLLLLCICAITDKKNTQIPSALVPMYVGFTILGIGVCFGANCGYALNPARDLSPRLITLIAGWDQSFSWNNYNWFWIPIVGPHIGAILGVFIYIAFVEAHWPEEGDEVVPITVPRANFNKERGEKIQNMDMESFTTSN